MNFNCVFPSCNFKRNDIEEKEFLKHLDEVHHDEIIEISKNGELVLPEKLDGITAEIPPSKFNSDI